MAYRHTEHPKPKHPSHVMEKVACPSDFFMALGTNAHFAVPCWYLEACKPKPVVFHNRALHDYLGWPEPAHADHSCQDRDLCCDPRHHHHKHTHHHSWHHDGHDCCHHGYFDMNKAIPIHLKEEGYTKVEVVTEFIEGDERVALEGSAVIDADDDWIVRTTLESSAKEASNGKPYDKAYFRLDVFVSGDKVYNANMGVQKKRDLVLHSKVCVLPTAVK